jgi:hypothetical protein
VPIHKLLIGGNDCFLRSPDGRRRKPVAPDRTMDVVVGGLRTFAQRERFGRPGDVGGGYWAKVAHHPAARAIAKGAELREPAMSLSKTANGMPTRFGHENIIHPAA